MYSNAKYISGVGGSVDTIRVDKDGSTRFVPLDPANTDYQNIMALVEKGELTIAPADE